MANKRAGVVDKRKAFLAAYVATCSIVKAAAAVPMDRSLHYQWMAADDGYRERFAEANERATDALEDEAVRRAFHGADKPLSYRGQLTYEYEKDPVTHEPIRTEKGEIKFTDQIVCIAEYSDQLLMFLLKARRPDKYRERGSMELTGPGGGPIEIVERLNNARKRIASLKKKSDDEDEQ